MAMGGTADTNGRVLVVCTGNICRSPFIERVMAAQLGDVNIQLSSAGTDALVGSGMDPEALRQLEKLGVDGEGHTAQQLTAEMIDTADLILTATRRHRGEVAVLNAKALTSAFAFRDFADLVGVGPTSTGESPGHQPLVSVVATIAARRGSVPPRNVKDVDIVDPYRQETSVFDKMVGEIMSAVPRVVRALRQ